jgi:PAS domain S-box-containing protein
MQRVSKNILLDGNEICNTIFDLLDSYSDPTYLIDKAGTILYTNTACAAQLKKHGLILIGANVYDLQSSGLCIPEIAEGLNEKVEEVLRTGNRLKFEVQLKGVKFSHIITPASSPEGKITSLFVIVQESNPQNAIEREEKQELVVYKSFHETTCLSLTIMDANGRMIEWNRYFREHIAGKSEKEMAGFNGLSTIHPDDLQDVMKKFHDVLNTGVEQFVEIKVFLHGGPDYEWRMIHGRRIILDSQPCILTIGININERKRIENELIESKKRFNYALDAAHSGVWEWDVKTNELIWSTQVWALFGLETDSRPLTYNIFVDTIHPDDREMTSGIVHMAAGSEIEASAEFRVIHPDGSILWLMSRGIPLRDESGQVSRYIGTITDITARKNLEAQLIESHARFSFMLEKSNIGGWELDLQNKIAIRTLIHDRIFGYESLLPEWTYDKFLDHIVAEDREDVERKFKEATANHDDWNIECRIRRADGEIRWIWAVGGFMHDNTGHANRLSGIVTDITERKQSELEKENLQLQLQHSQKMQLVGQLAGGIAHDFNNILTVILGHTDLALEHADNSYEELKVIKKAATHSAELTRQLLVFSRRQTLTTKVLDLNDSIEKMLSLLRRLIGENITLKWIPGTRNALVKLDPTQIDQILANICINSRDAIDDNGNITIETGCIHIDQAKIAAGHTCMIPGDYITLTVTDDGHGIDKQHIPHIIEPFFTTKEVGKGTGMGLSTVYGIVKQSNGFIDVESVVGEGTRMRIYLPMQRQHAKPESIENSNPELPHGKEMILLVEDQPDILQLCKQMLEYKGYKVLAAAGPKEATALAEQYKELINLLVTDVIMPEMNGSHLFKALQTVCPNLKVLFMSGYTADFLTHHLQNIDGVKFIEKPFTSNALIQKIQETLKGNSVTA